MTEDTLFDLPPGVDPDPAPSLPEELTRAHTITGHAHPVTSHVAAARALPRTGTQRRVIYDLIAGRGLTGATDDEVADLTGIPPNSVRPRRVELWQQGLIARSGVTRENGHGNPCDVWVDATLAP